MDIALRHHAEAFLEFYLKECRAIHQAQERQRWPALERLSEDFVPVLIKYGTSSGIELAELLESRLAQHLEIAYSITDLSWPRVSPKVSWPSFEEFAKAEIDRRFSGVWHYRDLLPPNKWAKAAEKLVLKTWRQAGVEVESPERSMHMARPLREFPEMLHWLSSRRGSLEFRTTLPLVQERIPTMSESLATCLGIGGGFADIAIHSDAEVEEGAQRVLWWCARIEKVVNDWNRQRGVAFYEGDSVK